MSHPTGFYDPNAGRYRGSDPEAAKAFRELQKQMQRLRPDVLFKIVGYHFSGGAYSVVALDGLTNVSGGNTTTLQFGLPSGDPLLGVNTLERTGHWAPLGMVVTGVRRLNTDGTDTIFFQLSRADVSGSNGLPGGGTSIILGPGPGDGPGAGTACPLDGTSCPDTYTVTFSGLALQDGGMTDPNGAFSVGKVSGTASPDPTSTLYQLVTGPAGDDRDPTLQIQCSGGIWTITYRDSFAKSNTSGCPPTGSYTNMTGDGATCHVS